jgi:dipeptidase D
MSQTQFLSLSEAKAQPVWSIFRQISKIPRCSKQEQQIRRFVEDFADQRSLTHKTDHVGNVLIIVPPTQGYEDAPVVAIQTHLDMVCEKEPDSDHDFATDPITLIEEDGWLRADKTTLGADNGLGVAMSLALADSGLPHPPLELLFTIDEETGLTGASAIQPDFVSARVLLNLDSEDDSFTIGCAGGERTDISLPIRFRPCPPDFTCARLNITGLSGGHSGIDIHRKRANAIKILARALAALQDSSLVCSIDAGKASNAMPRDAAAVLAIDPKQLEKAADLVKNLNAQCKAEFTATDPDLQISLDTDTPCTCDQTVISEDAANLTRLLEAIPHGVYAYSKEFEGLVETSSNLAIVNTDATQGATLIATSQRSPKPDRLDRITAKVAAAAQSHGATVTTTSRYPGWTPDPDSALLKKCIAAYKSLRGREPEIKVIHAGLECGVIGSKFDRMDMISFGPTIENAHSPAERVNIASVDSSYSLLAAILEQML